MSVATWIGALSVRVDITAATQPARLSSRDGVAVDPASRCRSELDLDDYDRSGPRLDNDGPLAALVAAGVIGLDITARRAA